MSDGDHVIKRVVMRVQGLLYDDDGGAGYGSFGVTVILHLRRINVDAFCAILSQCYTTHTKATGPAHRYVPGGEGYYPKPRGTCLHCS